MTDDIRIVEYKKEHAAAIYDKGVVPANYWCHFEDTAAALEDGVGFTMFRGDEVIGCAGVIFLWDGVGEAWALISTNVAKLKLTAFRYLKAYLAEIIKQYNIRHLEARPLKESPEAVRLVQHLGFKKLCNLPGFAPDGRDCVLYVISRKG